MAVISTSVHKNCDPMGCFGGEAGIFVVVCGGCYECQQINEVSELSSTAIKQD